MIFSKPIQIFSLCILFVLLLNTGYAQRTFPITDVYTIKRGNYTTKILLPLTGTPTQKVLDLQFSKKPSTVLEENGDTYAIWEAGTFSKKEQLVISATVRLERNDWHTVSEKVDNPVVNNPKEFLQLDSSYTAYLPTIQQLASSLKDGEVESTIHNIFNHIVQEVKPVVLIGKGGIEKIISKKKGGAREYAEWMVALCQANHIPARVVFGKYLDNGGSADLHYWMEAHIPQKGWVSFDPYYTDSELQPSSMHKLNNRYVRYSSNFLPKEHEWDKYFATNWYHFKFKFNWQDEMTPLFNEMHEHYKQHNYEQTLQLLNQMTQLDPLYHRIYEFKGLVHARKGEFEAALKNIEYAIDLAYSDSEKDYARYGLANYHALKGEKEKAIKILQQIQERCLCHKKTLANDEDLISLRGMPAFEALIESY